MCDWLTDCNDDKDDDNVDDDDDVQRRNAWRILTNMDLVFIFLFRFWQQKEIRINIYFLYIKNIKKIKIIGVFC